MQTKRYAGATRLALICGLSAFVLAFVNGFTAPRIEENARLRLQEALQAVTGGIPVGEERIPEDASDVTAVYPVQDGGLVLRVTGQGYGGDLDLIAYVDADGNLAGAQLLQSSETPGLGKNAENPDYMIKFIGTGGTSPVPTSTGQLPASEADAVSGATVTFQGVASGLERAVIYAATQPEVENPRL